MFCGDSSKLRYPYCLTGDSTDVIHKLHFSSFAESGLNPLLLGNLGREVKPGWTFEEEMDLWRQCWHVLVITMDYLNHLYSLDDLNKETIEDWEKKREKKKKQKKKGQMLACGVLVLDEAVSLFEISSFKLPKAYRRQTIVLDKQLPDATQHVASDLLKEGYTFIAIGLTKLESKMIFEEIGLNKVESKWIVEDNILEDIVEDNIHEDNIFEDNIFKDNILPMMATGESECEINEDNEGAEEVKGEVAGEETKKEVTEEEVSNKEFVEDENTAKEFGESCKDEVAEDTRSKKEVAVEEAKKEVGEEAPNKEFVDIRHTNEEMLVAMLELKEDMKVIKDDVKNLKADMADMKEVGDTAMVLASEFLKLKEQMNKMLR
jgi:hypothetical protein